MRPVEPALPIAPYIGGKRNLARRVCQIIQTIDHDGYAEPFVGMGGVFLRRQHAPKVEVINDLNRDVATLFRVLQRHYVAFLEMLRFQLTSRAEFERLIAIDPDTLTDLERAARFLYLQRTAFGGKIAGRNFGVSSDRPGRFDITRLGSMLEAVHDRLAAVTIECLPWERFIPRYDRPGMLFYLDPPYWGSETDYGKAMFSRDDFAALADALQALRGRFLLSINDVPQIRELFAWAQLEEVETTYTIAGGKSAKKASELLIRKVE